jgi:hypothetical protein
VGPQLVPQGGVGTVGADRGRELGEPFLRKWIGATCLELPPRDAQRVHRHERPELQPVVVGPRQHLTGEELEHRLDQLGCIGTVRHGR